MFAAAVELLAMKSKIFRLANAVPMATATPARADLIPIKDFPKPRTLFFVFDIVRSNCEESARILTLRLILGGRCQYQR